MIQRAWRGHTRREETRQTWRKEWDDFESRRAEVIGVEEPRFEDGASNQTEPRRYSAPGDCFSQLRLLTHFVNVKLEMDRMRLLYFGQRLRKTIEELPSLATGDAWTLELSRLGKLTVETTKGLEAQTESKSHPDLSSIDASLDLLILMATLIPKDMTKWAVQYYAALAGITRRRNRLLLPRTRHRLLEAVVALLKPITAKTLVAYAAFATQFLVVPDISITFAGLEYLLARLNYKLLAKALAQLLDGQLEIQTPVTSNAEDLLWILAHFIFLHKQSLGETRSFSVAQEADFVQVVSILLNFLGEDLRIDLDGETYSDYGTSSTLSSATPATLPSFVRDQINSLRQQSSITGILSYIRQPVPKPVSSAENIQEASGLAKSLATYALTLLRVFPQKGDEIRMWLYRGSLDLKASTGTSAIEHFWNAMRKSALFQKISRNHRAVLNLLKPPNLTSDPQIGRSLPSRHDVDAWREEWNTILLFLELYTFVLKFMDDEEFLSGDISDDTDISQTFTAPVRDGVFSLREIASLILFLKNLAFTLYWHASDLGDKDTIDGSRRLGAYFGAETSELLRPNGSRGGAFAVKQKIALPYLKGLVTGLLRMLHERDSRRNIFSNDHWLMTSQMDLMGFIPAVVAEEEKRHEMQDNGGDDEEEFEYMMDDEDLPNMSTGWDRPNFFLPLARNHHGYGRAHNPRQARYLEALKRKQEQAKKKRQLELLAPRLEILRNLPFFIPFETRVQIFREIVHRDQMRRRNGFIDPDLWRMSVAQSSQGRGPDGRPTYQETLNRHHAEIHRERVFEDAYSSFYDLGEALKEPIQISFVDKFDTIEAGIDGGGVTKEFLTSVTNEAFDPQAPHSMFVENDQHYLYPNPVVFEETLDRLRWAGLPEGSEIFNSQMREFLRRYEFLGRIIGKCLYEGILVDINFAGFFLLKWALTGGTTVASMETAYRANINDLRDLDEELYQGLVSLQFCVFSSPRRLTPVIAQAEKLPWRCRNRLLSKLHRYGPNVVGRPSRQTPIKHGDPRFDSRRRKYTCHEHQPPCLYCTNCALPAATPAPACYEPFPQGTRPDHPANVVGYVQSKGTPDTGRRRHQRG